MAKSTEAVFHSTVSARVAAEDITPGDMVAVLNEIFELPTCCWQTGSLAGADEPVRIPIMTSEPGRPFKVLAVCLPFVYTKDEKGRLVTFDTRRHQLVRLSKKIGYRVWKRMRQLAQ